MSPDKSAALKRFRDKYSLRLTFLSDPDHSTIDAYGAWREKRPSVLGVSRSTVVIGADGRIERAWYGVKADGHAETVLAAVEDA